MKNAALRLSALLLAVCLIAGIPLAQAAAVTVVVMIVPIITFVLSQSQILETMATSGLKD